MLFFACSLGHARIVEVAPIDWNATCPFICIFPESLPAFFAAPFNSDYVGSILLIIGVTCPLFAKCYTVLRVFRTVAKLLMRVHVLVLPLQPHASARVAIGCVAGFPILIMSTDALTTYTSRSETYKMAPSLFVGSQVWAVYEHWSIPIQLLTEFIAQEWQD